MDLVRSNHRIAGLLLLLAASKALAGHAEPAFIASEGHVDLGLRAEQLEDPGGELRIDDLIRTPHAWRPLPGNSFSAGFSRSAWWLRVRLEHDQSHGAQYFLDTGSTVADYIDVYLVRDGQVLGEYRSGDRRPFATRPLDTHTVVVPIHLEPRDSLTIFLRLDTWDGLHEVVGLKLLSAQKLAGRLQLEAVAQGVYYGTLIAILLYNLFLFLFLRERVFGLYLFYVAAFLGWSFILRGYGLQYFWPESPHFNNQALPVAACICYVSFGLFALEYLNIKREAPRWLYRAYLGSIGLNLITPLPAFFGFYALTFATSLPTGILMVLIAVGSGVLMIQRGSRPAKYFLTAFSFLAVGVLLYYLQLTGAISAGPLPEYGIQVGSALEVLLLAFGLADQMNTLKADKLKAEQTARLAQLKLTGKLTAEVKQRTAELELANERLQELATTDALTGAMNRRRFNEVLDAEFERHQRLKTAFAFCMIDIDKFKSYNDRYGHQAGDEVLQKLSNCLRGKLRRQTELLFRLGGEEFGILLGGDQDPEKSAAFVESLRLAVVELAIPHAGADTGVVTASFGLLSLTPGSGLTRSRDIYIKADELLYQAKAAGRNRVVHAVC